MQYDSNGNMTVRGADQLVYDSENRLKQMTVYEGESGSGSYTLQPGWNVISFSYLPDNRSVSSVLSSLTFGTDYDQVSTWDSGSGSWKHWVNDPDFNDFTEFEYGKTYEIYITAASARGLAAGGKSPGVDLNHQIKSGDNFISPAVKQPVAISSVLSGLTKGTHYSDVKRFNPVTKVWESFAAGQFSTFEPGRGYNILGLTNSSFSYGKTTKVTSFVYDSSGARVKKIAPNSTTVYLGKDYDVAGSLTTKYLFLGDRRIASRDSSGVLLFYHEDHISSSNVLTDGAGNQAGLLEYDPYGSTVTQTGSANPKHKFTGQEADDSTRLYYYNARYYDPQLGRFITADWIVQSPDDPQTLNRYSYCRNNPINYVDPSGNIFWFVAAIVTVVKAALIGAAVGAVLGVLDAAVSGKSIGKSATAGAIGGAIGGGISGVASPALMEIGDILGKTLGPSIERIFTVTIDASKIGMSGIHVARNIKNREWFSLGFNSFGTVSGIEDFAGNRVVEHVEVKARKQGVDFKRAKPVKDRPGVFEAEGNADVFNPNSDDFKNNMYGQIKEAGVFQGDHIGDQKRFWGLHVHDFEYTDHSQKVVKSFKFHYDPSAVASPFLVGAPVHGMDFMQYKIRKTDVDKSNSMIIRSIESQRTRIK